MINKNFLLVLTCLLGILFPSYINAQKADPTFGVGDQNGNLTPHQIVVGILLIITGIIFCFFGRRVYKLTLFMIGFYVGTIIAWIVLSNAEPNGGYINVSASQTLILLVSLAVGFIVGLVFICCSSIAIWFLGALAGYTLALFILSWKSGGLIQSQTGRIIFIVVLTVAGLLMACCLKNVLIILATAFIGSYAIILGVDMFAKTGFAQSVRAFMDGFHDPPPYETNTKVYLMLGGMVALFIVGSIIQFRYHRNQFGPYDAVVAPEYGKSRWRNRNNAV